MRVAPDHYSIKYYYQAVESSYYIVYDVAREHVELCSCSPPTLTDGVFANFAYIIKKDPSKQGSYLLINTSLPELPPREQPSRKEDIMWIFYDVETVSDPQENYGAVPWAVSILMSDYEGLEDMEEIENRVCITDEEKVELENDKQAFIDEKCHFFDGFDCMDAMLYFVKQELGRTNNARAVFVGFNNSNFDDFCLFNELSTPGSVGTIHFMSLHGRSRMGSLYFGLGQYKCSVFDLRRHLNVGSLADICKSFKINRFGKRSDLINFEQVQTIYNEHRPPFNTIYDEDTVPEDQLIYERNPEQPVLFLNKLYEAIEATEHVENGRALVKEYSNYDVLSIGIAFYLYIETITQFDVIRKAEQLDEKLKPIWYAPTLPGYLMKINSIFLKQNKITLPKMNYDDYEFIRKGTFGGRVQAFNGAKVVHGGVLCLDRCSMYPSVMFVLDNCYYPGGEIIRGRLSPLHKIRLESELSRNDGLLQLGYYTVSIDQRPLYHRGIPLIVPRRNPVNGLNYWEYFPESLVQKNIVLHSVHISMLKKNGCRVEFVADSHFIEFSERIRGYDLFGWMSELMTVKNKYDRMSKTDPAYNHLLKTLAKFMSNSVSGKFYEQIYFDQFLRVKLDQYNSGIYNTQSMVPESQSVVCTLPNRTIIMQYEVQKDKAMEYIKPIYVGSFIYAYAQEAMFGLLKISKPIYCDTDSVFIKKEEVTGDVERYLTTTKISYWPEIAQIDPLIVDRVLYDVNKPKVYGCLVDEAPPDNNITFINGKKEYGIFKSTRYFVVDRDEEGVPIMKYSLKGISNKSIAVNANDPELGDIIGIVRIEGLTKLWVRDQSTIVPYFNRYRTLRSISDPSVIFNVFHQLVVDKIDQFFLMARFIFQIEHMNNSIRYGIKAIRAEGYVPDHLLGMETIEHINFDDDDVRNDIIDDDEEAETPIELWLDYINN
jgi:hypothetical protein